MKHFIIMIFFLAGTVMLFGQEQCIFRTQPQNADACLMSSAVFEARADTLFFDNDFYFEWFYKTEGSGNWVLIQNNSTFTITKLNLTSILTVVIDATGTLDGSEFKCSVSGLYDSETAMLSVNDLPIVSFNSQNFCFGDITGFTNTSPEASVIKDWTWDFSDGSKYTSQDINHLFPAPGDYEVKLTGINDIGCVGTDSAVVTILPLPDPVILFTKDVFCGFESNVSFYTEGNFASYLWEIKGTNETIQSESAEIVFDCNGNFPTGQYEVSLKVSNENGCYQEVKKGFLVLSEDAPVNGYVVQKENDSKLLVLLIENQENSDFRWLKIDVVNKDTLINVQTKEMYHLFDDPIDAANYKYGVEVIPPFSDCSAVFYLIP
jgi:PKD repeat protein